MRKTLLLVFALLFSVTIFAQNRAYFVNESFNGTTLPTGWTISGYGTGNWSISTSSKAGGQANELMLYWSPEFNGISRVIMPSVDLTGISSLVVSFKHYLDNYNGGNTIGIATSLDGDTWNTAWSQVYSTTGLAEVSEIITSPDMGNSNVMICLFYQGNSYNINNWYFDDIEIFSQENLDAKLANINIPGMLGAGEVGITFSIQNLGVTTIESLEVQYTIDELETVTETFAVNIEPLATQELTFAENVFFIPGSYHLSMNINSVNGTTDDIADNNTLEKTLNVALGSAQKIAMIEHFSSSTCGPCVSVNTQMGILTANNPGKFAYTKYQMNWPGAGDPYYTNEGGIRKDYYGVSAVPQTFLDGADQGFAAVTQNALDASYNTPSFANIRGAFNVDGNNINVIADFMSYVNMNNVKAYIAVNEKVTTGNVGGNGETEFHHVFMKMLENGSGNDISINAGEYQRLEFTFDMSSTNVEDINDLEVSMWLQDHESKEVFNSHFAYEYTEHAYPVQNLQITNEESTVIATWEAPESGSPTGYNVFVNNQLAAENTNELSYSFDAENAMYIIEVVALYDDEKNSVGVVKSYNLTVDVAEVKTDTYKIFPNPANNYIKVSGNNINTISIYNCLGALVDRFVVENNNIEINTSNYNTGIYFINIQQNDGVSSTNKLVVTH